MKQVLAMVAALLICSCSTNGATTLRRQPPPFSRSDAEQLMLRADDIKRLTLDGGWTARLTDAFRGRALQMLAAQAQSFKGRALRMEELDSARTLVFWDPHADEAVLQVVAQRRLVTSDQPNPAWAATVRQWWARLQYADGSWWVVEQQDLSPDRWRPVAPAG
ncbi:MAG: hypothetical protein M3003_17700 [Candidatus Dormibacteraeota bacterium]|nr:hypothetical protein [Candidatus Dormibacteraeota bacterium]